MDLGNFIRENKKSGGLSIEISNQVEKLWKEYKLDKTEENCSVISADFGRLGSLNIKEIASFEKEKVFKYESGSYDYISTKTKSTTDILWTDYQNIEPYIRKVGIPKTQIEVRGFLGFPLTFCVYKKWRILKPKLSANAELN